MVSWLGNDIMAICMFAFILFTSGHEVLKHCKSEHKVSLWRIFIFQSALI
jgi:hypothetical protein